MQLRTMILVACLTTVPVVAAEEPVPYCQIDPDAPEKGDCTVSLAEEMNYDEKDGRGCPSVNVSYNIWNIPDVPNTVRLDPRIECIGP